MTHYEYKEKLSALLDDELSEAERDTVLAHLDACEDCRAYFAELNAMHEALGELEEYDTPENFAAGVMARLHEEQAKKVSDFRAAAKSRRPWRSWGALAACAAAVVLAVVAIPQTVRMGKGAPAVAGAPAEAAPMLMAPAAPPDEYRAAGSAEAAESEAPASSEYGYSTNAALYDTPEESPAEPVLPAGSETSADSKLRAASDSGVSPYAVTAGPNGESASAPAASMNDGATSGTENSVAESTAPVMTLMGNGAADWLAEHGEPLGDGRWRVSVEDVNTLPDTLALVAADGLQEPVDGMLIVTYGTTENPR